MSLLLYGGYDEHHNSKFKNTIIEELPHKKGTITFIPVNSMDGIHDFYEFTNLFKRSNKYKFLYFPIDSPVSPILLKEVFKSDLIHLGGGNTFYFLKHLKRNKLFTYFKNFYHNGGVLSGLSAGGIILTPSIETASFPSFDRDFNEENLKDVKSLSLFPYEFFPHYKNSKRYENEMIKRSLTSKIALYAVPNGSLILYKNKNIIHQNKIFLFKNGERFVLR